jgi:hypothetical protein
MEFSLDAISRTIPHAANRTKAFFVSALLHPASYLIDGRHAKAAMAVLYSSLNAAAYTGILGSHAVVAVIQLDSQYFTVKLGDDISQIACSVYFAAALSAYLFMSIAAPGRFPLKLPGDNLWSLKKAEPAPAPSPEETRLQAWMRTAKAALYRLLYYADSSSSICHHVLEQHRLWFEREMRPRMADLKREAGEHSGLIDDLYACLQPSKEKSPETRYQDFVTLLRRITAVFASGASNLCRHLALEMSYFRFAEIQLYTFCRELIIQRTRDLPKITMENFVRELKGRNEILNRTAVTWARAEQKLRGFLNLGFDPGKGCPRPNVPYADGDLRWNGKKVRVLRHGTPVVQHDFGGAVAGLVSWIPVLNWFLNRRSIANLPKFSEDYDGFLQRSTNAKSRIGHGILENGEESALGDESARFNLRIDLETVESVFPFAFRCDGKFFKHKTGPEDISALRERIKGELFTGKGFKITQKVRAGAFLDNNIDRLLQEVETLYFPRKKTIDTIGEHQAFIVFSYVHIILYICQTLNISILELLCKDDKDRGVVLKLILKFHFLYITRQLHSNDNLEKCLVQALAPSVIIKDEGIIPSREKLVYYAFDVLKAAYDSCPNPPPFIGGVAAQWGSYEVVESVTQMA